MQFILLDLKTHANLGGKVVKHCWHMILWEGVLCVANQHARLSYSNVLYMISTKFELHSISVYRFCI